MSFPIPPETDLPDLPEPDAAAVTLSSQLVQNIVNRIESSSGIIGFDEFMQMALYEPGLGYYSGPSIKFGESGDFVTAPEVSSMFGYCLAQQVDDLLAQGCAPAILEFGAGSGRLCEQVVKASNGLEQYLILELSADLRRRQFEFLQQNLPLELFKKIEWLDALPDAFDGVVLANEVLDAMPVNLIQNKNGWKQRGVGFEDEGFVWRDMPLGKRLELAIEKIETETGPLPDPYLSEVNLNIGPWFASLSESCNQVVVLIIDYGYEQAEYYHASRHRGTLICHYQHRAHYDPFVYPGLQDITASVDFDAVADMAIANGFEAVGLVPQNRFLLANQLLQEANRRMESADATAAVQLSQQLKTLSLPQEMGEKFKVLALQKDLDMNMPAMQREGAYG